MGRPKGSKNKVKGTRTSLSTITMDGNITSTTVDIRDLATPIEQLELPLNEGASEGAVEGAKIRRVTNEQYDERFYYSELHVNSRTGTHWFPAYHFLTSMGAPTSDYLIKWYKDLGHEAERVMKQKEIRGSWIHDAIERMTKWNVVITEAEIQMAWGNNEKDMLFVKRALTGFLNFMEEEQVQIVSSEKMIIFEDWAGTMDLEVRMKRDDYKNVWVVDVKTAQAVYEEHKQQVESYRRAVGADRGAVLLLGNSTKKRFTLSEVSVKKSDYYYKRFQAIKETAYIEMEEQNRLQPTIEIFPTEFKITSYVPSESITTEESASNPE